MLTMVVLMIALVLNNNEIYVDGDGFGDGDDEEKHDKYDVYNYDYGGDDLRTMWIMVLLAI